MTDILSKSEENSYPMLLVSPLTLQKLASMKIALCIWLKNSNQKSSTKLPEFLNYSTLNSDCDTLTDIPHKIRNMIKDCFQRINFEMRVWFMEVPKNLTCLECSCILRCWNLTVLGGDGTVHFDATIANFFLDDSINNVSKFKFACLYCVEEKIDFFWPLVSDEFSIGADAFCICDIPQCKNFLMRYWICRKNGLLSKIPLQGFSRVELLMIALCERENNCAGLKYFLTLLNPHDRFAQIEESINCYDRSCHSFVLHLFPYFDAHLQRRILDKHGIRILEKSILGKKPVEYVVQIWIYVRDLVTGKDFYQRIIYYFMDSFHVHGTHKNIAIFHMGYEYFETVLVEIWSNTPQHLKNYVLNFHFEDISHMLRGQDITFLLTILPEVDDHARNTFWIEEWPYWINVEPHLFDWLTKLCLLDTKSIEVFKGTFANNQEFRNHCDILISAGRHDTIDKFLHGQYSNQDQILDIKKDLLANCVKIFQEQSRRLEKHAKYIDDLFSNDDLAKDFKNQLITSEQVFKQLCELLDGIFFSRVVNAIWLFASPSKYAEVRRKFLPVLHNKITNGKLGGFGKSIGQQFLLWCLDNDRQQLNDFKKSLPIRDIFRVVVSKCLNNLKLNIDQFRIELSDFLIWFYESTHLYEEFVRKEVDYYEKLDKAEIKRIFVKDKKSVMNSMRKFLKNNDETRGNQNEAMKSDNEQEFETESVKKQKRSVGCSCSVS